MKGDRKLEALKQVPLFADCSERELEVLARNTDELTVDEGRTVITQGKLNDTFFIILDGRANVTVGGRAVGDIGRGDVFGEISMLDRGHATATVVASTPLQVLVMSHLQFRDAVKAQENIAFRVIATMAQRLRGVGGD